MPEVTGQQPVEGVTAEDSEGGSPWEGEGAAIKEMMEKVLLEGRNPVPGRSKGVRPPAREVRVGGQKDGTGTELPDG